MDVWIFYYALIILIIIYFCVFHTMHIIINILCRINGRTKLTYVFNYSDESTYIRTITYSFDHSFYDGSLMKHYIYNSTSLPKTLYPNTIRFYQDFQIVNHNPMANKQYTSFTYSVVNILEKMKEYYKQHYDNKTLNVCVLMSKRHILKNETAFGNFITFPKYTINITDSYNTVCEKHAACVAKEKTNRKTFFTLYDGYCLHQSDIVFVSNRDTSLITRKDGNMLQLLREPKFKNEQHMYDCIFSKSYVKFVFLDCIDNQWMISDYMSF